MTALSKYQRLECGGLWRPDPDAQRRNVTVSFGEASLVISDSRSETPVAHWSLPAVARRNPGERPALYSPDADVGETLEIDDPDMIGALETVASALRKGRRPWARLRLAVAGTVLLAVLVLGVGWLPGALVAHAARVLPASTQAEIGRAILADLAREGQPGCGAPLGLRALTRLQERLGAGRLVVVAAQPGGAMPPALVLPGGLVILSQRMVEEQDSPEVAAGHVLAALAAAAGDDPLLAALQAAGLRATLVLLTTGEVPARALRGHGAARLAAPPVPPDAAALAPYFAAAAVAAEPYALATGADGEALAPGHLTRPVLGDGDWVSLQGICHG